MEFSHVSVLLRECMEYLHIQPDGVYVDGTLGGAGHSKAILSRLSPKGCLIGIDRDADAIAKAGTVLAGYMDQVTLVRSNFADMPDVLDTLGVEAVDGILLDLGVSSYQLDEPSRGFSYMHDAPLDMRMDNREACSAYDVINGYSVDELCRIISEYGEERWARRIAEFVAEERSRKPIETTFELVSVIKKAVPKAARQDGPHPAKRTFQAIRIEVNGELAVLEKALATMAERLRPEGRLCVITFHSLEDRIVKQAFRNLEEPCICPRDFPVCICNKKPLVKVITRKPVLPSEEELSANHRARSAKLRVAQRLD